MERLRKKKNSGVKVRKKNGQKCAGSSPGSDVTRRQRLDLKGPRVKHVCRSASIVLGQPQATFPLDKRMEKIQVKPVQGKDTNMYMNYVRFGVFTAVTMKNGVFWDVTPCGSCKNRRFGGT
jgi:hypothetical protein